MSQGKDAFLEQVRTEAQRPSEISLLALDLERLRRDFSRNPWVSQTTKVVASFPNKVRIELQYREPTAFATVKGKAIYLDSEGFVLPTNELVLNRAGVLFAIEVKDVPNGLRPGFPWGLPELPNGETEPDKRVRAAAQLAGFLKHAGVNSPAQAASLHVVAIHPEHPRGLFVQLSKQVMVLWGEAPGQEPKGRPSAMEKWEILRDWVEHGGPASLNLSEGEYAVFSTKTLLIHQPRRGESSRG